MNLAGLVPPLAGTWRDTGLGASPVPGTLRRSVLSQESMLSTAGTPRGCLGRMRLHEEQFIPVGVAKPKHRRLGFRLLYGADADLDG